jgi:hypothetical protein
MNSSGKVWPHGRIRARLLPTSTRRYYGVALSERTLVPDDDAQLGKTRFADWLKQSPAKAAAASH